MRKNDYIPTKRRRPLLQQDMRRRYTKIFLIFQNSRTSLIYFFLYPSPLLQLSSGASRKTHASTLLFLLPLVVHIVLLWCIKDFTKNNKMEESLYHIVSPNYRMKVCRLHIE